ncbi:MAG: argininosuccinate lyase [Thermoguttaceae bacterium]|nr:argininosuccinate lyase [Thermoguttaceae bacterium]MDW8039431.1 argininosuccinate lyase [Thermoguttaceae bacterium]
MSWKPWAGVFTEAPDPQVEQFTESVSFDRRLYSQDIRGSVAHAQMLAKVGLLTAEECQQIEQALHEIEEEIRSGRFVFRPELEDIHMHIERALTDRLGDVGRKLHTARSRNDQVATAMRLWVREAIEQIDYRLRQIQEAFVGRCERDAGVIVPGYTHLRRAQPVLAAHYWLCYCEKFQRDRDRLSDCRRRVNMLPLGAAALAGTSLPIDRHDVARRLGFVDPETGQEQLLSNSLDAVSDRDFLLEFVFDLALISEHLSTWAEEWILWSSQEFGFLKLPEAFCTGSSIMPQKRNPDVLELIRGKTARVIGDLQTLLVLIKGLPLAYNRDLQEDKPPVFDAFDTVRACLEIAVPLIQQAELDPAAIAERLDQGYLDATSFMEYLIQRGVPQRTAHHQVGRLVRRAMELGISLAQLPFEEIQQMCPEIDQGVFQVLGARQAVLVMQSYGSTAPAEVERQIQVWKSRLAAEKAQCQPTLIL